MATQTQALVAGTPVDLSDGLSLGNSNHKFQNSGGAPVFIAQVLDTAADPVQGDPASVLAPGVFQTFKTASTESHWAWTEYLDGQITTVAS